MHKFIKHYALEIYTVVSMLVLLVAALIGDLSAIQKFVAVYIFLFVLHEWEEMKYPGGFADLIAKMLKIEITDEMKRASRIPTSVLLLAFTLVPFILRDCPPAVLPLAFLGLFEGVVHIFAIRLFRLPKFYSPGLATAEIQAAVSIILFAYLIRQGLVCALDFLAGFLIMAACFIAMQKIMTMMIGYKYGDLPKMLKRQLAGKDIPQAK